MKSSFNDLGNSLFEVSPNMIIIVEENALISSANPFALEELGFNADELNGKELNELFKIPNIADIQSSAETLNWLISQYKKNEFIEVKTGDERVFKSRVGIGNSTECADGCVRRVICIHDSGDLENAVTEQGRYKYLLDTALGAIPDGFAVYDEDDRLQIFNKAYEDVYWRSKPILNLGEKFEDILRYGLKAGQYLLAGSTEESQEAWLKERLRLHNDPTGPTIQNVGDRWLRVEERKLDDGRIVGIRADITALVEAKSTAEMLGNVLDNMAAPVIFTDSGTKKFEYANKAALNKLLYTLEEFVELRPMDISLGLSEEVVSDFIQSALDNPGTVVSLRSVHRRKDGTTYPCVINSVCETEDGSKRIISFIQDETEEVKIRSELELQQAELQTIVHSLPCFITHSKPDTTLKFVNEDYASFYNCRPEDIIGKKFVDFVPGVNKAPIYASLKALTEESPVYTSEREGCHENGTPYVLLWTNRMIFKNGVPYEIVSVGREITEKKNAKIRIEKQAHELGLRNKALEQFAGIVSHDLRSPLRHIRMFGEMLMEDFEEGKTENYSNYIGKMRQGVQRMERLISSLLEFSQVAYKQVNRSTFMLGAAVDEARNNLADTITDKNARILLVGNDIKLNLDYVLFVRLLENLFDNGVKYCAGSNVPEVHIHGQSKHNSITISIIDNGIGIPPDQSERIFNVFQRLHINEETYKGTGVGLALVKRIVEGHNGMIELDKNFSGGAKFDISFPITS